MNEENKIKEYNAKLEECDQIIQENQKLARQLRATLKEVEDLKQQLQQLINLQ